MQIVEFEDGTYGIRRGKKGNYEFLDLREDGIFWWGAEQLNRIKYCSGTAQRAQELYKRLTDVGEPV